MMDFSGISIPYSASPLKQLRGMPSKNHALVVGVSGLIGWAVVEQLLQNTFFGKVTALVNRRLSLQDSFWPSHAPAQPTLSLTSGVSLLRSDYEFVNCVKQVAGRRGDQRRSEEGWWETFEMFVKAGMIR